MKLITEMTEDIQIVTESLGKVENTLLKVFLCSLILKTEMVVCIQKKP